MVKFPHSVNLLPDAAKQSLTSGYYFSLATLLFFFIAVAALAGAAILAPSYLVAKSGEQSALQILDSTEKTLGLKEKNGANAGVLELVERVKILGAYEYRPAVMPVLSAIGTHVTKNISVRIVKMKKSESGKGTVTISGVAATRVALLAFVNALKTERIFTAVSIPVEQLAGESDIEFTLTFPFAIP